MGASLWPDGRTSSDWIEIAGLMREMERECGQSIAIVFQTAGDDSNPDLQMTLTTEPTVDAGAELALSAFLQYRATGLRMASLKGLLFFLLYQMDFEFGRVEGARRKLK